MVLLAAVSADPAAARTDTTRAAPARPDSARPLRPADLFRLHRTGEAVFSPDGDRVAFERKRPGREGEVASLPGPPHVRSDVWIADVEGGDPRPVTDGAADGTSWFHPRWSPDGERLALLSARDGRVRAWVWNRRRDRLRKVSERPVHMEAVGPALVRWLGPRELALGLRPEGAAGRGRLLADHLRPGRSASRLWRQSRDGRRATVDVLASGDTTASAGYFDRLEIVVLRIGGGAGTVASGRWGHVVVSPDGATLATFSQPPGPPEGSPDRSVVLGTEAGVRGLREDGDAASAGRRAPAVGAPRHRTLEWAPDGGAYALLTDGGAVARYERGREAPDRLTVPGHRITGFAWTGGSALVARARPGRGAPERGAGWWRLGPGDGPRRIGEDLPRAPRRLVPAAGEGVMGVAGGELWRLGGEDGAEVLTEDFDPEIRRVVWPDRGHAVRGRTDGRGRRPGGPLVVLARGPEGRSLWTIRFDGAEPSSFRRIPTPGRPARLSAVSPSAGAAVFSAADSTGTWLWLGRSGEGTGGEVDTLLAADRWLSELATGKPRRLTYRAGERELTAWMILPPDHRPGQRHPTVVDVYPGRTYGRRVPRVADPNIVAPIRALQLLAARGYAVLLPSVPLRPDTLGPRHQLDDAVLPAVEEAVDAGLADSARIGLVGHSYGGYGVMNLVSQTDRFRAAVASAGIADLRSRYGTFDPRSRYGHMNHPLLAQLGTVAFLETGQGRMGAPPWEAPGRYRRNSPLSHVEDVETPLMLIHGDRDHVPIQQAEQFFTGLLRQGKPARLVRYAGEGHVVRGRANVLDMWRRIPAWFDRYLAPGRGGRGAGGDGPR